MTNFLLFKIKNICIYIGPYELAFNDPEVTLIDKEELPK